MTVWFALCGFSTDNCYFTVLPFLFFFLYWASVRLLDVHTYNTSYCVHWFCWIPTNNLWSIASLSRLMLCFWLMSATINGLMLPNFLQPRTNPPIWVTVGSTGKQKHVCTVTHLSSDCHSFPSWSFIQLLFLFNYLFLSLSLCLQLCLLASPNMNTWHKTYNYCPWAAPLTSPTGATLGHLLFKDSL